MANSEWRIGKKGFSIIAALIPVRYSLFAIRFLRCFRRHLPGLGAGFLDGADHEEGLLGHVVAFAVDYRFEGADRVLQLHELAGRVGELLGDVEGLRQEALEDRKS